MKFRTLIKTLSAVFTLALILILALVVFLLGMDPNDFKPQITKLAGEQDVQLRIDGDLDWQFYPNIELQISDVALTTAQAGMDIGAELGLARLSIDLRQLIFGELSIHGIEIESVDLRLSEAITTVEEPIAELVTEPDSELEGKAIDVPELQISEVRFSDFKLRYQPLEGEAFQFSLETLVTQSLNLRGEPFPLQLVVGYVSGTQHMQISTDAEVVLNTSEQKYGFKSGRFELQIAGAEPSTEASANLAAEIDLVTGQWKLKLNDARTLDLAAEIKASGTIEPLSAAGDIQFTSGGDFFQQIAHTDLLKAVELKTDFAYSAAALKIEKLDLVFNDSKVTARLDYAMDASRPSTAVVSIDQINLDDYTLAGDEGSQAGPDTNPLAFMADMPPLNLALSLDKLLSSGQEVADIGVYVSLQDSKADIALKQAGLAKGLIRAKIQLIAQPPALGEPQVRIREFSAQGLDLGVLSATDAGVQQLQGLATANFSGQLQSLAGENILVGLNGNGQVAVENLRLNNLNIEQSICVSAQQLGGSAALVSDWPVGTEFDSFVTPLTVRNGVLMLEGINTGFGNVQLSGSGDVNLDSMDFAARLSLLIAGERTSDQGCSINKYLRNTSLPLACSGNLSTEGEASCGLDSSVVETLLVGQIQNQLERQLNRLLGGDEDSATEDSSDDAAGGSSESEALRGLLEGIFNR